MVVSSTARGSKPSTPEKRRRASGQDMSSDSDSGGSLFITQSAAKKVERRKPAAQKPAARKPDARKPAARKPAARKQSTSKKSSLSQAEFLKKWNILEGFMTVASPSITKAKEESKSKSSPRKRFFPKKGVFPFLLKSQKQQHLSLPKHQVLENSEVGGFFKCMKKIQTSTVQIPNMLEFVPSDDLEEENSDHEISIVNKADFVHNKSKQKWLTQSILDRRVQDAQDENLQNQSETFDVLAECSDSELSDFVWSEQNIMRSGDEASDTGHVWVVEETQRLTQAAHEDARTDAECSSLFVSKGGDVSKQNHTQHENGTGDLEETILFMHDSDQDSDATLIDADKCVSKSGPATPRRKTKSQGCSETVNETTQPSTRSISTSPAPPLLVKDEQQKVDNSQTYESQDASQSLLDSHTKLVPKRKRRSQKRKKKSCKYIEETEEDTDLEEDTVIHPASGPVCKPAVEMSDSPLFKLYGHTFLKRKKKGKKTNKGLDSIQCETNVDAGGGDITGLTHKDKRKSSEAENNRTNEEQSGDTSRLSVGSDGKDILQVKKKKVKKQKLEEREGAEPSGDTQDAQDGGLVSKKAKKKRKRQETDDQDDNATINLSNGNLEYSGSRLSCSSRGEKTSESLETCNEVVSVNTTNKKKKKQKMQNVGPDTQQSVETVQNNNSVLSSKKTKKGKNKKACEEENDETSQHVVENLEMRLNDSIRPSEAHQPENTQTTEETERCSSPSVTVLKSGKKKKKKRVQSQPDVNSVSQEKNGSSIHEFLKERAGDEHLKSNTDDTLNDAKRKKKKKKEDRSDLSSHLTQSEETPKRRKKKNKKHSDGLVKESSKLHNDSGNSQSLMSTPSEIRSKKTKKKKDEEIKEADKSPVSLANVHKEENNAEKQVTGNSGVKIKKRKKDIEFTDSNMEVTSAETVLPSQKDRKKEGKQKGGTETVSVMEDHSETPTDDVSLSKKKKRKSKVENVSILDTHNSSIHSEAERTFVQNDQELPKIKKKKRKSIANE